jgi:hypothetical protein
MSEAKKKIKEAWPEFFHLLTILVGLIISMLAWIIPRGIVEWTAAHMKGYGLIVFGFMGLLVIMMVLVSRFKRGPTKVVSLKNSLINAFCGALESSSLNPKEKKGGI